VELKQLHTPLFTLQTYLYGNIGAGLCTTALSVGNAPFTVLGAQLSFFSIFFLDIGREGRHYGRVTNHMGVFDD